MRAFFLLQDLVKVVIAVVLVTAGSIASAGVEGTTTSAAQDAGEPSALSAKSNRFNSDRRTFGLDRLFGHAADGVMQLASVKVSELKLVQDAKSEQRIARAIGYVRAYNQEKLKYARFQFFLQAGNTNEPNAFSTGPSIWVTQSLAQTLNDRELVAVLAHEMAHSEQAHFFQRVPFPIGAILLELFSAITDSPQNSESSLAERAAKFWQNTQSTLFSARLGQELEADCIAARWLAKMHAAGLANEPEDLNRATASLFGIDPAILDSDDPAAIRYWAIKNKFYLYGCPSQK